MFKATIKPLLGDGASRSLTFDNGKITGDEECKNELLRYLYDAETLGFPVGAMNYTPKTKPYWKDEIACYIALEEVFEIETLEGKYPKLKFDEGVVY